MSFYTFRLDKISVKHKRGNLPDEDVVTFIILINQVDRGHGTGRFNGMVPNEPVPLSAVPPNNRLNIDDGWDVGPLEVSPGDIVHVVYTGTNISDEQIESLNTKTQDEIEIKILNAMLAAGLTALGDAGDVAALITGALNEIKDPVSSILGFAPQGPCNGPVFSDAVEFSGSGLDSLQMVPPPTPQGNPSISFTKTYTDEATHDPNLCGHKAETDITFTVFRRPFISVRHLMADRFQHSSFGVRRHGNPGATTISLKSVLGLRSTP
jgi:hypothetical protein